MGITTRSAQRRIDELKSLGVVVVTPRTRPNSEAATTNEYRLVQADEDDATRQRVTPDFIESLTPHVTDKKNDLSLNHNNLPNGRLGLHPLSSNGNGSESFQTIALKVIADRTENNTLPISCSKGKVMQLAKDVIARVGEDRAYTILMELPSFTPGCADFAIGKTVKGRSKATKNGEVIARGIARGANDERY
jgi:hypothetical protein